MHTMWGRVVNCGEKVLSDGEFAETAKLVKLHNGNPQFARSTCSKQNLRESLAVVNISTAGLTRR